MRVVLTDRPPVVIEFNYDEARRLYASSTNDFPWDETTEEELWGMFNELLAEGLWPEPDDG